MIYGIRLQVIIIAGEMEMTWGGELVYRGRVIGPLLAIRTIRYWAGLGLYEAKAIWDLRQELID